MKITCHRPSRAYFISNKTRKCKPRWHVQTSKIRDIILYSFGKGQPKRGVEKTPRLLARHLNRTKIHSLSKSDTHNIETASIALETLRTKIKKPCIVLGGDHTVSIGSIISSLVQYPNLKVIYFDAHGDINTPESSLSGNKHGMVLSYLLEKGLDPKNLLYIGIRCLDPYEVDLIDKLGIQYLSSATMLADNVSGYMKKIANFVSGCPIHLSLDVDVLDKSEMPSTGIPLAGGIKMQQILPILHRLSRERVVTLDIAEFNVSIGNKKEVKESLNKVLQMIKIFT